MPAWNFGHGMGRNGGGGGGTTDTVARAGVSAIMASSGDAVVDYDTGTGLKVIKATDTQRPFVNKTGATIAVTGTTDAALTALGLEAFSGGGEDAEARANVQELAKTSFSNRRITASETLVATDFKDVPYEGATRKYSKVAVDINTATGTMTIPAGLPDDSVAIFNLVGSANVTFDASGENIVYQGAAPQTTALAEGAGVVGFVKIAGTWYLDELSNAGGGTPAVNVIEPNTTQPITAFGITPQDFPDEATKTPPHDQYPTTALTDYTTAMTTALEASSEENILLDFPPGRIGTGPLDLPSYTKMRGAGMNASQLYNLDPWSTFLKAENDSARNMTIHNMGFNGGWRLKGAVDNSGTNWDFDATDPIFDGIYGLALEHPTSIGDSNNDLMNILVSYVAGTAHYRKGGGNGSETNMYVRRAARWAIEHDDAQDIKYTNCNLSQTGLGGWKCKAGTMNVHGAKVWFIGMALQGEPEQALFIDGTGNGSHRFTGFDTSDTAGTPIKVRGRNIYIEANLLGSGGLGEPGGDVASGFGNPNLTLSDYELVELNTASGCEIDVRIHEKRLAENETSGIKPYNIVGLSEANYLTFNPRGNRDLFRTTPFDAGAGFEAPKVRDEHMGNFVTLKSGAPLLNWNKGGLTTLVLTLGENTINNPNTFKTKGFTLFCDDIGKDVVASGPLETDPWYIKGTFDVVTTTVISTESDPATLAPNVGDRYLIDASPAAGAWAGNGDAVATYKGGAVTDANSWTFAVPVADHFLTHTGLGTTLTFNGTAWA